jgi:hypothetical protein
MFEGVIFGIDQSIIYWIKESYRPISNQVFGIISSLIGRANNSIKDYWFDYG